jgi:hypothetical protein
MDLTANGATRDRLPSCGHCGFTAGALPHAFGVDAHAKNKVLFNAATFVQRGSGRRARAV